MLHYLNNQAFFGRNDKALLLAVCGLARIRNMVTFQRKKQYWQMLVRPLLFCGALTYLIFHALNGNHGIYALLKEQHKRDAHQRDLAELKIKRSAEEHRVALLSDQSLDLDLLDERARVVLGYADKDEYIYIPQDNPSPKN